MRGANWNNGSNAGAFALNLNNAPGNRNNNIGFRCASDYKNARTSDICLRIGVQSLINHKVVSFPN